jgi:uncharacterized membrane protein YoaK (UPF0700 family)
VTFLEEVKETLVPSKDNKDGPLTPLLVALTFVTGLVDAVSYLVLGRVFVANMTGNVVFLAFAFVGAKEFSIASSLLAIAAFLIGSFVGGSISTHIGQNRGKFLSTSATVQTVLILVGTIFAVFASNPVPSVLANGLIICLALSMGIQNATARKLPVPDLTTTGAHINDHRNWGR